MDIEYKVVSGLAVFAQHLFDIHNIGQYIACLLLSVCTIFVLMHFDNYFCLFYALILLIQYMFR